MTAADRIRARIAELEGIRERYLAYQQDRVNERDHHGAWDVAVNLSETECEIAGLRFALDAIEAVIARAGAEFDETPDERIIGCFCGGALCGYGLRTLCEKAARHHAKTGRRKSRP